MQKETISPTNVSEMEVKAFIQDILENESKRNYAIVVTMAYTGIRVGELLNLKLNDINLESGEMIIRDGKGGKQRTVQLNSKVKQALGSYIKVRKETDSDYLITSRKRGKLHRSVVNKVFKKYSDKISPHTLRHFFCTNALEKGLSIHEVAYQVGHSDINTTMKYLNPSLLKLKEKIERL